MKKAYITVAGMHHHFRGSKLALGLRLRLVKEKDNEFDSEAIRVEGRALGKIGYVANSVGTVRGKCMSAGRLYDAIDDKAFARVIYSEEGLTICEVELESITHRPESWGNPYNNLPDDDDDWDDED